MSGNQKKIRAGQKEFKMELATTGTQSDAKTGQGTIFMSSPYEMPRLYWETQMEIMNRLNATLAAQQEMLRDMTGKWTGRTSDMQMIFPKSPVPTNVLEKVSNSWDILNKSMSSLISRLMNAGNGSLEELNREWMNLGQRMNAVLLSMGQPSTTPKAYSDLMNTWMAITNASSSILSHTTTEGSEELRTMQRAMNSLLEDLWAGMFNPLDQKGSADALKAWGSITEEMTKELSGFINRSISTYSELGTMLYRSTSVGFPTPLGLPRSSKTI